MFWTDKYKFSKINRRGAPIFFAKKTDPVKGRFLTTHMVSIGKRIKGFFIKEIISYSTIYGKL